MMTLFDLKSPYLDKCDTAYQALVLDYKGKKHHGTSCQDVLQYMLDHKDKVWWWAWELIGKTNSKGGYLSHRAPARVSDLAIKTNLVEHRKVGRFKVYRVRLENLDEIKKYLWVIL